jgi:hypothetical protein
MSYILPPPTDLYIIEARQIRSPVDALMDCLAATDGLLTAEAGYPPQGLLDSQKKKRAAAVLPAPTAALDHPSTELDGMTMDPIFPQPGRAAPLSHLALSPIAMLPGKHAPVGSPPAIAQRDRISRIATLGQGDTAGGPLWLAMNFPAVCDAMLDKVEFDAIDDEHSSREP